MKKHLMIAMAVLALCCVSCKPNNNPEQGQQSEAPNWVYTPNSDSYRTMTIVCSIPKEELDKIAAKDELAALSGDGTVLGVGRHVGDGIYYLMVSEPDTKDWAITIVYYQSAKKRLFKAEKCITFSPDDVVGTYSQPYIPFK